MKLDTGRRTWSFLKTWISPCCFSARSTARRSDRVAGVGLTLTMTVRTLAGVVNRGRAILTLLGRSSMFGLEIVPQKLRWISGFGCQARHVGGLQVPQCR